MSKSQQQLLLPNLLKFYKDPKNIRILDEFINHEKTEQPITLTNSQTSKLNPKFKSKLTIGLLDWFTTDYAIKNNVQYYLNQDGEILTDIPPGTISFKYVNVSSSYNTALSAYKKPLFDPFARGKNKQGQIKIKISKNKTIVTNIRQLNYFRWAIENGVITYIKQNINNL